MESNRGNKLNTRNLTLSFEHNPYEVNIYLPKKASTKVVVFPTVNYQGDKQYIDLIYNLVDNGYKIITLKLLNVGDRVLFFNYYFTVFINLFDDLVAKKIINKEELVLMGFGLSANIVAYTHDKLSDNRPISKLLLLCPVNRYKSEYRISREIGNFKIPTYVFYAQFDKITDISTRYLIYEGAKYNPNVHFSCYAATGYYLYYKGTLSMEMSKLYRHSNYDLLIGESHKNKNPFLPSEPEFNELFFKHLLNALSGRTNPKRIALLTDVCPLFTNGVGIVVQLLKDELDKLGYETYIVALWKKYDDFGLLPSDHYIPVIATEAKLVKGYKELSILKSLRYKENAKMLSMFGFDYLHLHTEYSMSYTALELAKITGIKMPYTYHTIWRFYYRNRFGKLIGDVTYKAAKALCFNKVFKECPIIIVPSLKSFEILKDEVCGKDIRIIPSAINQSRFVLDKADHEMIRKLKNKYKLDDRRVLGYVGRVSTEKNIVETINYVGRMVKEIPNIVFMIVGTGDAEVALQKTVKKLHLEDHVIFVGPVENSMLKCYYALFDVFVTASNFETQGLTYFEAAQCGCLILAKEDKAIEGIFKDGETAYVYKDFYQWAERIEKALFYNNRQIIENAKNMMKNFTQESWARKMLAIYQELNDKKK